MSITANAGVCSGAMKDRVPVSVLIPTIGRPELLRACLRSIFACDEQPDEVIVVDQSQADTTERVVAEFAPFGALDIRSELIGPSQALNLGLAAVRHDSVLITNDDCTVDPAWISTGAALLAADVRPTIITGRVLPVGNPEAVPSTKIDIAPHDYTGERRCDVLYGNNMALPVRAVTEIGGFDELLITAEDNDLCYRWLNAGRRLEYRPELVVFHHDWRTKKQLDELYVRYAYGMGQLYGKYLRLGDFGILRFLRSSLVGLGRTYVSGLVTGRPRWADYGRAMPRGLPAGIWDGWRRVGGPPPQ